MNATKGRARKALLIICAIVLAFSMTPLAYGQEATDQSSEPASSLLENNNEGAEESDDVHDPSAIPDESDVNAPSEEAPQQDPSSSVAEPTDTDPEQEGDVPEGTASKDEIKGVAALNASSGPSVQSSAGGYKVYRGASTLVSTQNTLKASFDAVNADYATTSSSSYTITVSADDPAVGATAILSVNTAVTIRSADANSYTLSQTTANARHISFGVGSVSIANLRFDGGGSGGGIALSSGASLTLDSGGTISNCYSVTNGGGIAADCAHVTLKAGSSVDNNQCGSDPVAHLNINGRGIWVGQKNSSGTGSFTMEAGSQVTANTSACSGGGIYSTFTTTINGTVSGNDAYRSGGGLYFGQSGASSLLISGATFSNNTAYGYASTSQSSSYVITGGGAIMIHPGLTATSFDISGTTFTNNAAPTERNPLIVGTDYYTGYQRGGAILFNNSNSNDSTFNIDSCTFSGNRAQYGGALSLNGSSYVSNSALSNNSVSNDRNPTLAEGGAIYFNGGGHNQSNYYSLYLSGGNVTDNSAYVGAGIGYINTNVRNIFVDGTPFSNNQIETYMYIWDTENPDSRSTAEQNYAQIYQTNILNVDSWTEPSTNLYNNADITFSLLRYFSFITNGGIFDDQELTDYLNTWYKEYYFNVTGTVYPSDMFTPSSVTSFLDGFTAFNTNGSYVSEAPAPAKSGDTFLGWYLDDSYTVPMTDPEQLLQNYRFYALWQSMMSSITYEDGVGDGSVTNMPAPETAVIGSTYTVSTTVPLREGYTLKSWLASTTATGSVNGQEFAPGETFVVPDEGVELTAQWTLVDHIVHYASGVNDGSVTNLPADDDHVPYTSDYTVSSTVPLRPGYDFVDWKASTTITSNVNDHVYYSDDHFDMPDDDVVLTAEWKQSEPTPTPPSPPAPTPPTPSTPTTPTTSTPSGTSTTSTTPVKSTANGMSPKTGDSLAIGIVLVVSGLSVVGLSVALTRRRPKHKD